jgi:hypothetical protein
MPPQKFKSFLYPSKKQCSYKGFHKEQCSLVTPSKEQGLKTDIYQKGATECLNKPDLVFFLFFWLKSGFVVFAKKSFIFDMNVSPPKIWFWFVKAHQPFFGNEKKFILLFCHSRVYLLIGGVWFLSVKFSMFCF